MPHGGLESAGNIAVGMLAMAIVAGISFTVGQMGREVQRNAINTAEQIALSSVDSTVITLNSNSRTIPAAHLYMIISQSGGALDIIRSVSPNDFENNTSYELRDYNRASTFPAPVPSSSRSPIGDLDAADTGAWPIAQTVLPPRNPPPPVGDGRQRDQDTYMVRRVTRSGSNPVRYTYVTDANNNPVFETQPRSSVRIRDKIDLIPIFHKQLRVRVIQLDTNGDQSGSGEDDWGKYVLLVTDP